ncbi:hypothetical protein BDZ91DRAFT_804583 [Kalaharituber pfeilii]|nr:hypothetical protein BDZ91DRAFT_804583 [Kalaharituber pfeilii]
MEGKRQVGEDKWKKLEDEAKRMQQENAIAAGDVLDSVGEELSDVGKKTLMKVFIYDPKEVVIAIRKWSQQEGSPCYLRGNYKAHANVSVPETDIICLLSDTELEALLESTNYKPVCLLVVLNVATHEDTPDPKEIGYFNKYEYGIESNTYEDLAEDSNVHWVLARASREKQAKESFEITCTSTRRKAKTNDDGTPVEKSKKRQSSSKIVQKLKVRITVKKATGKRMITQIILNECDPSDDSRDQDVEKLRQDLDNEEEPKSDAEEP